MLRTRTCGELRASDVGATVTLAGWVDTYRDHGGVVFIDLRDRYGKTQIVFNPDDGQEMLAQAQTLRSEFVVQVTGDVMTRPKGMENADLATGEIDLRAKSLMILNTCPTPPFEPGTRELPNEDLRLEYRFIDLRRDRLQKALALRHQLCQATREYFNQNNFLEIETPMLGRSTPEGARDYLVPSRVHPGAFYALPQSPQIYKQILMVSGYDRYYQIARCFRDEDLRAERQPEFTQIDVEMAFVDQNDVLTTIDGLVAHVTRAIRGEEVQLPLPRYAYREVMERFGSDKPDMRFGLELVDVSAIVKESEFGVFKNAIASGGRVRGINAKGASEKYSQKGVEKDLTSTALDYGAKGLAYLRMKEGKLTSSIAKFFSPEQLAAIAEKMNAEEGDLLLFVASTEKVTSAALSALRNRLGRELQLYDPKQMCALWVVDFPLLSWNAEENRYDAEHHPFCQPVTEDVALMETDPGKVRATSYDLVVNGYEAASGSIRIHSPIVQQKIFDLLNINAEQAEERFGFLLNALRYGAPPHGGIALGLDRWVMLFCGLENIRDVIAFPKTQKASDRLTGAPAGVDPHQLRELHIQVDLPEEA